MFESGCRLRRGLSCGESCPSVQNCTSSKARSTQSVWLGILQGPAKSATRTRVRLRPTPQVLTSLLRLPLPIFCRVGSAYALALVQGQPFANSVVRCLQQRSSESQSSHLRDPRRLLRQCLAHLSTPGQVHLLLHLAWRRVTRSVQRDQLPGTSPT